MLHVDLYPPAAVAATQPFAPAVSCWEAAAGGGLENLRQAIAVAVPCGSAPAAVPTVLVVWVVDDSVEFECERTEPVDEVMGIDPVLVGGSKAVAVKCKIGCEMIRIKKQLRRYEENGDLFSGAAL